MGDENTVLNEASARHLLRRTGFGAHRDDLAEILDLGETRGQAVDRILDFKGKAFKPGGRYIEDAHNKWVKYLVKAKFPIQEKLVLFWHDHFATGNAKVQDPKLMAMQIQLLHKECKGNFKNLVKLMNKNAAMMEWLDTVRNFKAIPNENYARELLELFTVGVLDSDGNPNYDQEDIVQIARAFTGWDYLNNGKAYLRYYEHDEGDVEEEWDPPRGPKVIFKTRGQFGNPAGQSFDAGEAYELEIDNVIDVIFQHRDTDMKNTVARRTARRLIEYFAHPEPSQTFVDSVVTTSGFDVNFEIAGLLRAIFVHDDFYLTGAPQPAGVAVPWGSAPKASVKWPIDFVVSTLRVLDMKLKSGDQYVEGGSYTSALNHLTNMGQILLDPPSVFGWDWENNWLSSATLLARYNFAVDVTSARGGGKSAFRPDNFEFDLDLSDPLDIVNAAANVLGIRDHLTSAEKTALVDYLTENGAEPSLDLNDYDVRNIKLNGLFALLLQSPAYQLH